MNHRPKRKQGISEAALLRFTCCIVMCLTSLLAQPVSSNIIGLVEIPALFQQPENGTLSPRPGIPLKLYKRPDLRSPARLLDSVESLDWVELGYEDQQSIAVFSRTKQWLEIGLKEGKAWIQWKPGFKFHDLDTFFGVSRDSLGHDYLTNPESRLAKAPGRALTLPVPEKFDTFNIVDTFKFKGQKWLKLEFISGKHACGGENEEAKVLAYGWLPLFNAEGKLNFWYHSRGC